MFKRTVSILMLSLLLGCALGSIFNIQKVEASGNIYIRADGSIDPSSAPIQRAGDVYTFTNSTGGSIVVERDNIVIDGNGYGLQGTKASNSEGIDLSGRENVTVRNTQIQGSWYGIVLNSSSNHNCLSGNKIVNNTYGIYINYSSNNSVIGNNVTANNGCGIKLDYSSNNSLSGNAVVNNGPGIWLTYSNYTSISGNDIANNGYGGISLTYSSNHNSITGNNISVNNYGVYIMYHSSNNKFYHNIFINNAPLSLLEFGYSNIWDNGYPSGGNYWSDYTGIDQKNGPYQNLTGSDGIGDTACAIDSNNQDHYPLMNRVGIIPGDINGDAIVDIYDAILIAGAFNSQPGSPKWNHNADINGDGIVDIYDAIILANHFGQHFP